MSASTPSRDAAAPDAPSPASRPGCAATSAAAGGPTARDSYHHGDLKAALVRAGYEAAREHGVDSITLRALTRQVGVTPGAAYRHFANGDELKLAISLRAMSDLARTIEESQASLDAPSAPDAERARRRLAAVGLGYIGFALDQPGAFAVAMFSLLTLEHAADPEGAGASGRTPHQLLTDALAGLVATGQVDADRADGASVLCWSGVHGFATLATQGPMRLLPREVLDQLGAELVDALVASTLAR